MAGGLIVIRSDLNDKINKLKYNKIKIVNDVDTVNDKCRDVKHSKTIGYFWFVECELPRNKQGGRSTFVLNDNPLLIMNTHVDNA